MAAKFDQEMMQSILAQALNLETDDADELRARLDKIASLAEGLQTLGCSVEMTLSLQVKVGEH